MDEKGTNRLLALLVFVSSSVAAFSLGALAYTFATGSLPFGIQSMIHAKSVQDDIAIASGKAVKASAPKVEGESPMRLDEEFLASFAAELKKEKEKLAAERLAIEEQRKSSEQIMVEAKKLQDEVRAQETQVDELLKKVDAKERANVADLQKLISGMELANSVNMLLSMDELLASRILYSMNKKQAAKIIETGMKDADKSKGERIKSITRKMQSLSDELAKGDSGK